MINVTKKNRKIDGNVLLMLTMLYIMVSEWNLYEWFCKFSIVNYYIMSIGFGLAIMFMFKKSYFNDPTTILSICTLSFTVVVAYKSINPILLICFVFSMSACFILCNKIILRKIESIIALIIISFFFFYWTVDVKGYFKGYDTAYGAMILLSGFMASIFVIEYVRFLVKEHTFNIGKRKKDIQPMLCTTIWVVEIVIMIIGIRIMLWYQSIHAVIGLIIFMAIIILPKHIITKKYVYLPTIIVACAYTSLYGIWTYLVLNFGLSWFSAAAISIGMMMMMIFVLLQIISKCYNSYFAKLSFAAALSIIVISSQELFIVLQPFPIVFLFLCGATNLDYCEKEGAVIYSPIKLSEHIEYLKKNYFSQLKVASLIVSALAIQIFIRIPFELYYGNQKDLLYSLYDFAPYVFMLALGITIIGGGIIAITNGYSFKLISIVLTTLAVLYYIQDMFLNIKLCETDGSPLILDNMLSYSRINSIVWIVLYVAVFALLYFRKEYLSIIKYLMLFLIAIQTVGTAFLPVTIDTKDHRMSYGLSCRDELSLACEQNTIVFILDNLGTVQVDEALEEYENLFEGFEDFTYYSNADSVYRPTYPSITHMMTGEKLDFSFDNAYEWLNYAWTNNKTQQYYQKFNDNGIKVYFYSKDIEYEMGDSENIVGKFENVLKYQHLTDKKALLYQIFKMAMFRIQPYALKSDFVMSAEDLNGPVKLAGDDDEFEYYNWKFAEKLIVSGLTVDKSTKKALKIYHLSGTHEPCLMNKDMTMQEEEVSIQDAVYGSMEIVRYYISEMKKNGTYDNSTIIVTADHGTDVGIADPQPIFMVKRNMEDGEKMKYNDAPISHEDLLATYYDSFGLDYSAYGKSIFDYNEKERRERTLWFCNLDKDTFSLYTYIGNRDDLLAKFPDNPDDIVKNKLYWTK